MKPNLTVLITGASTGIGRACVRDLAARGYTVFAGVRTARDAEALVAEGGGLVEPLLMDVTDYASVQRALDVVRSRVGGSGLTGLVNNAGISVVGPLECLPMAEFDKQLRVNVSGQLAVTQAALPLLRMARGRIVFMSSESGRVVMPLLGAYAASKHALEAVSDAFRRELGPAGIHVSIIEPGSIKTPIWEKGANAGEALRQSVPEAERLYGEQLKSIEAMTKHAAHLAASTDVVTRAVYHALSARWPKVRYLVGPEARGLVLLHSVAPARLFDWGVTQSMRLIGKLPGA